MPGHEGSNPYALAHIGITFPMDHQHLLAAEVKRYLLLDNKTDEDGGYGMN